MRKTTSPGETGSYRWDSGVARPEGCHDAGTSGGATAWSEPNPGFVGDSAAARALRELIAAVAPSEATVLITGETGTGKGLVARSLHAASPRCGAPFVHVDCAALPPALIESELFGHERGAFTGAHAGRRGRFERAGSGTLFLDEIGELAPVLQAKLLRALQDRVFERVGGGASQPLSARVIAATNRELHRALEAGRFREDLYYRLQVVRIHVPPLRERLEDLPLLAAHWLSQRSRRGGRAIPALDGALLQRFRDHRWPGNVRELYNALERWLIAAQCADVAEGLRELLFDGVGVARGEWERCPAGELRGGGDRVSAAQRASEPPPGSGAQGERSRISAALQATGGNVARAARRLRVPRSTLRRRIRRYRLHHLIPRD